MNDAELHRLADHRLLEQLMYRFAAALDRRDWAAYRAVFTDELDIDYDSYRPGSAGRMPADEWVDRAATLFAGLDATQHAISNVQVTVDGDVAEVRSYITARHLFEDADGSHLWSLTGYYDDRAVRTADGWLLSAKRLVIRWAEGDRGIMRRAVERARAAAAADLRAGRSE